jgi:hypothetical protein
MVLDEREVDIVLVNVSAFAASSLSVLASALVRRPHARVIAGVLVVTAGAASDAVGRGSKKAGPREPRWELSTRWVRLSRPEQLRLGLLTWPN